MTTLKFERHDSYGKVRHYPKNKAAEAIVLVTGRKCLKPQELVVLEAVGGFVVEVSVWPHGSSNE